MSLMEQYPAMTEMFIEFELGKSLEEYREEFANLKSIQVLKKAILKQIDLGLDKNLIASINGVSVSISFIDKVILESKILKLQQEGKESNQIVKALKIKKTIVEKTILQYKLLKIYFDGKTPYK